MSAIINTMFLDKMSMPSTVPEILINNCPICIDDIFGQTNKIITECGHVFHTSCLMKHASINGFTCPYCRNEMAEKLLYEEEDIYDDEDLDIDYIDDYTFRSLRWFTQRIEGEELDEDTEEDTSSIGDELEQEQEQDNCIVTNGGLRLPTPKYIMEKLQEKNISVESLITTLMIIEHDDAYHLNNTTYERMSITRNQVYGAFRAIMSQFRV